MATWLKKLSSICLKDIANSATLWAHIEASVSIIAACLPTLVPLTSGIKGVDAFKSSWSHLLYRISSLRTSIGSGSRNRPSRPTGDADSDGSQRAMADLEAAISKNGRSILVQNTSISSCCGFAG